MEIKWVVVVAVGVEPSTSSSAVTSSCEDVDGQGDAEGICGRKSSASDLKPESKLTNNGAHDKLKKETETKNH